MNLGRLATSLCLIPLAFSGLALGGWISGNLGFASVLADGKAMAPLTALGFASLALGPLVASFVRKRTGGFLLTLMSLLGLAGSAIALRDLLLPGPAVQAFLIPESLAGGLSWPNDGKTSSFTAIVLVILSLSFLFQALALSGERLYLASWASVLGLAAALAGFAVLTGFLYRQPLLKGAVSLPSGFCLLALGASACLGGGREAWPVRLFLGSTVEARLLRPFVPLVALVALGSGALLGLAPRMSSGLPFLAVSLFALFLFLAALAILGLSRGFAIYIEGIIAERRSAEARLAQAMDMKDKLLGELNHRTRNSLQLVLSLVDLEEVHQGEGASLRDRVGVLALVHDSLVRGDDPSAIAAANLVSGLASYFGAKGGVEYRTRAGDFHLLFDLAAPLSILAAEIDALMRASLPQGGGKVVLGLWPGDCGGYILSYEASWLPGASMAGGLEFARNVARYQLDGSIALEIAGQGTTISINAGECAYERRI